MTTARSTAAALPIPGAPSPTGAVAAQQPASGAGAPDESRPAPSAILGAYASLPESQEDQEEYYRLLAQIPGARGLEIPFRDDLGGAAGLPWLASQLAPHWDRNIITAIPGTMVRVWATGAFGLASTDRQGRADALSFTRSVRDGVEALREAAGRDVVAAVEIHSAPSGEPGVAHSAEAFGESLSRIVDYDWGGALLLVEHCDAFVAPDLGEKRLLGIDEELEVLRVLNHPRARMSLNWGRSALEARDAATALEHVRLARAAGVLEGVMFSGAGPADTRYAKAWMDGHLPLDVDEPGSVMGAEDVRACSLAALEPIEGPEGAIAPASYLGAKCQVPAEATPEQRLSFLTHILDATRV
ncbi:DUF4862 family protein [Actinomyces sp. zg296]|uniref:DUF4862 family protein n=1 Tax=Actinomyces sp. zg296 TaxID=2609289 RepID=UPI00135CBB1F|nr:DUF4862 family protein [Actinomyces sp. zg296]